MSLQNKLNCVPERGACEERKTPTSSRENMSTKILLKVGNTVMSLGA